MNYQWTAAIGGAVAICLCTAGPVYADPPTGSVMDSETFGPVIISEGAMVELAQFDDLDGCRLLQKVTLTVESLQTLDLSITNLNQVNVCNGTGSVEHDGEIALENLSVGGGQVVPFDVVDLPAEDGIPGGSDTLVLPTIEFPIDGMDMRTENLAPFIGQGTVQVAITGNQAVDTQLDCNVILIFQTAWEGTVTVTYDFKDVTEACCLSDGNCVELCPTVCTDLGGTPQGPATVCDPNPCPTEACCLDDGNCIDVIPRDCTDMGGTPQGPGTECLATMCPTEACCLDDGNCIDVIPRDCTDMGGTPQGPGTECAGTMCPTEACCLDDGNCIDVIPRDCTDMGGTPQGPGTECAGTMCPTEACCLDDGNCIDVIPRDCTDMGGDPQGPGTECVTTMCPTQACCLEDGNCIDVIPRDCTDMGGTPQGPDTECATTFCPTEACCLSDGNCLDIIPRDCTDMGGTPQGPGTICDPNPCPTEACCLSDGNCLDIIRRDCTDMGGTPQGPGTICDPNPCPTEACCFDDDSCQDLIPRDCTDMGGTPQGPGTVCEPNLCGPGDEGCTPGYWKQPHHFDDWAAPYTPDTLFCDVFFGDFPGDECAFPGLTLLEVLSQPASSPPGPNQLNTLGRHTVAALLNAASSGVSYEFSVGEVIDMFNAVYPGTIEEYNALKSDFAAANEAGCPLNGNADADGDGLVGITDLLKVIGYWGTTFGEADLDEDGIVGIGDYLLIIGWWGS